LGEVVAVAGLGAAVGVWWAGCVAGAGDGADAGSVAEPFDEPPQEAVAHRGVVAGGEEWRGRRVQAALLEMAEPFLEQRRELGDDRDGALSCPGLAGLDGEGFLAGGEVEVCEGDCAGLACPDAAPAQQHDWEALGEGAGAGLEGVVLLGGRWGRGCAAWGRVAVCRRCR